MKINRFIYENRWFDSVILVVFILAFTGATYNHMMDLVSEGLFPYTKKWGTPESLNLYWTSLTILDPLAIAVLIINVRAGYVVALCIMFIDVPINLYANAYYWSLALHKNYALLMQMAFLIFLAGIASMEMLKESASHTIYNKMLIIVHNYFFGLI